MKAFQTLRAERRYLNYFCLTFSILLVATSLANAQAMGTKDGGGGRGVVCQGVSGRIAQAEFFDLYEAEHTLGLHLFRSQPTVEQEIAEMQTKVDALYQDAPWFKGAVKVAYEKLLRKVRPIPLGTHLDLINDSIDTSPLADGCKFVQIARYVDGPNSDGTESNDYVQIDGEYWNLLSPRDKVALAFHEIHYRSMRTDLGALDSRITRRYVGYLFSKEGLDPVDSDLPTSGSRLDCTGANADFTAYQVCRDAYCETQMQFFNISNQDAGSRTLAVGRNDLFAELATGKIKSPQIDLTLRSKTWSGVSIRITPGSSSNSSFDLQIVDPQLTSALKPMVCAPAK